MKKLDFTPSNNQRNKVEQEDTQVKQKNTSLQRMIFPLECKHTLRSTQTGRCSKSVNGTHIIYKVRYLLM